MICSPSDSDPGLFYQDRPTTELLRALGEFEATYRALSDAYGDELSSQVVFSALGQQVNAMLRAGDEHIERIVRYIDALEIVAQNLGLDALEEIAYCFFDGLEQTSQDQLRDYLGPATYHLLELAISDEHDDGEDQA